MFIAALFLITRKWKQSKCLSISESLYYGTFIQYNKCNKIEYNILYESQRHYTCERLPFVWFHVYGIPEKTKLYWWRTDQWLPEVRRGDRLWPQRESRREFFGGWWNCNISRLCTCVLKLIKLTTKVSILLVD